jgi:hypothetical protein
MARRVIPSQTPQRTLAAAATTCLTRDCFKRSTNSVSA